MFYISKTTEFPDMLNCFIEKMFQSRLVCPAGEVRFVSKTVVSDAGKTTEILYICQNEMTRIISS